MRRTISILALVGMLGACATAQYNRGSFGSFGRWDANGDGYVDDAEWEAGFPATRAYLDWDRNTDGFVDNGEWTARVQLWEHNGDPTWEGWDLNDDDRLTVVEVGEGLFDIWDRNDDARLDATEFSFGVRLY